MMNLNDLAKPAVGRWRSPPCYVRLCRWLVVARNPEVLRRLARSLAGGVEKISAANPTSREELADLWAEARDEVAQQDVAPQDVEATGAAAATSGAAAASRKVKRTRKPRVVAARPGAAAARKGKAAKTARGD